MAGLRDEPLIHTGRGRGCLGWLLVWVGVAILFRYRWDLAWSWLALAIGLSFLNKGFRFPDQRDAVFPGAILTVSGLAVIAQLVGFTEFDPWRLWPIFFIGVGLGAMLLWGNGTRGKWILLPALFFLIIGGYGIGSPSWYRYLRHLRRIADLWPMLLFTAGVVLVIIWWRKRQSEQP